MSKISSYGYLIMNLILVSLGTYCLYIISNFWIGTEQQHHELIMNYKGAFFLKKFILNLGIIFLFIVFMGILNTLLKNEKMKNTLFYSLLLFLIISAIFIYMSIN